ncbi:MAG: aspartyl/asparaginyl beta-hydroxylase domain-containing protein [Bacteroidia bacterium]
MTNNTAFQLPIQFDATNLYHDLTKALQLNWSMHYNTKDYDGRWTSISLVSASGNETDTFALPATHFKETPLLLHCTYFKSILDQFLFEKETVRLMCLAPGSIIKPHRDRELAYRYGNFRLHIPITTDEQVEFIVDGKLLPMQIGTCWYADFDAVHEVKHQGTQERIHLVIDGIRNAWTDALFVQAGYDFEAEKRQLENRHDEKTTLQIIEELERQNNPASAQLIEQLRSNLSGK